MNEQSLLAEHRKAAKVPAPLGGAESAAVRCSTKVHGHPACVAQAIYDGGPAADGRYPHKLLDVIDTFKEWWVPWQR